MKSFEPDLLLLLIAITALLLTVGIVAAVHYLWKMLRKDVRWPGLQNPYGWPAELLGDIDANTVDKSICKKRLRPSRIERNAKKFQEVLADVLPETEPPPVPVRVDSLTKAERQMFNQQMQGGSSGSQGIAGHSRGAYRTSSNRSAGGYERQLTTGPFGDLPSSLRRSGREDWTSGVMSARQFHHLVRTASDSRVRRSGSGYREERRRSPRRTSSANLGRPSKREDHVVVVFSAEDNEPPPPYSEIRQFLTPN